MKSIEVLAIERNPAAEDSIRGFFIDSPKPGSVHEVHALKLEGWFLSNSDAPRLELLIPGQKIEELPLNVPRRDLPTHYPDLPSEPQAGFRTWINGFKLPAEFEMHVMAHNSGRPRIRLATIRGRRQQPSPITQRFQPIVLTSFGRTGGTWAANLIGRHPEIVALRPFEYEPRIATYWIDVFTALSEPGSYLQSITAETGGQNWWLGKGNLGPAAAENVAPEFVRWLGKENIEALLAFCQDRIEQAYEQVAILENRPHAKFFVERSWPNAWTHSMMRTLFPGGREIVLVRDPRDMVASILDFNRRRGQQFFGRNAWTNDEDYVRSLKNPIRDIVNFWRQGKDRTHLLKYEDLVLNPQDILQSVLEYVGVDADVTVIDEMLRTDGADSLEARRLHQTSASAEASIGRWQRDLSDSLVEACDEAFGEVLQDLGYVQSVAEASSRA